MKIMYMTPGKQAPVDDGIYDRYKNTHFHMRGIYAVHTEYRYPKSPGITSLHKLIMNVPEGMFVDHINGDGLDNRRENLRIVTHSQNMMNRRPNNNTKSGYKGVAYDHRWDKWFSRIGVDGRRISLGMYDTKEEAAIAYNTAAIKYYGEYAKLNILDKDE